MECPQAGRKLPSNNTLWLGQRINTPFQENQSLNPGASFYGKNSAAGKWPTFPYTKAHRLHDIKTLCDVCDRFDITALTEGRAASVVLRDSFFEIARTASRCRLCSLIAQSYRGASGAVFEVPFLEKLRSQDAVEDYPVHAELADGKLHIRIPRPEGWPEVPEAGGEPEEWFAVPEPWKGWLLGTFNVEFLKGMHVHPRVYVAVIVRAIRAASGSC